MLNPNVSIARPVHTLYGAHFSLNLVSQPILKLVLAGAVALMASGPIGAQLATDDPRNEFYEQLLNLCDAEFVGASSFPADPDDAFHGKRLVAKVAECSAEQIRIPFIVGDDTSRTWLITRTNEGLRLQHDHRHADGSPDEITMYGGWASTGGSARSQSFEADEHTRSLIPAASTNVWTISLDSDGRLTYYLERHSEPRFSATLKRTGSGRQQ